MAQSITAYGPGFGGDGGFFWVGADGKLHWVPPWDPEITRDMGLAAALSSMVVKYKDTGIQRQLTSLAESLGNLHAKEIQKHLGALQH